MWALLYLRGLNRHRGAALQIGTAELANWRGDTKRQLAAALDEFAILSRAISAEEVRKIYDSGRP